MATNKITTGSYMPNAAGPGTPLSQNKASDAGVELTILFDAKSVSEHSPIFVVRPGEAMLLSGFGFQKGYKTIVEKLRLDTSLMPAGGSCEGGEIQVGGQTQAEDVTQCGLWALTPCQNVGVLAVPGTYRLRLGRNTFPGLGTIYVDAMRLRGDQIRVIPEDLFFGKVTAACC